jgi:uncharacterized RDD family membrane protein YckC
MTSVVPESPVAVGDDQGVFYATTDSPGFIVRLLVDVIDLVIAIVIADGFLWLANLALPPEPALRPFVPLPLFVLWWMYLVALKCTRVGSLGYLVFGIRAVNLKGERPSLLRMTLRVGLSLAFNHVVDLIHLMSDDSRQALRDKLSETYLIKRKASPLGRGRFVYSRTFFLFYALVYREVKRCG